nr:hypothetical protein [Leptospira interrogans]
MCVFNPKTRPLGERFAEFNSDSKILFNLWVGYDREPQLSSILIFKSSSLVGVLYGSFGRSRFIINCIMFPIYNLLTRAEKTGLSLAAGFAQIFLRLTHVI